MGVIFIGEGDLRCAVSDNEPGSLHGAGYNGLVRLELADGGSPFIERFAGLNLEHYFDARPKGPSEVWFEPRRAAMALRRVDERVVELHQSETPAFGVESWIRFEAGPQRVDLVCQCLPHREGFHGGFLGLFWASYIDEPEDKSIYFLTEGGTLDAPRWAQFCTQRHGHASTLRHEHDHHELPFEQPGEMLYANLSSLRYSEPFFYGRWRDNVLIYLFPRDSFVRFAQSPSGGGRTRAGDDTCPAWDFQFIVPRIRAGQIYSFAMRLVYKEWAGRADVLAQVRRYLGQDTHLQDQARRSS